MTLVRTNTMQAGKLGRELREEPTPALSRRRKSIGFCLASIASLGVITLSEPESESLDAEKSLPQEDAL